MPLMSKKCFRVASRGNPQNFMISLTRRSVALSANEEIKPALTEDEYNSGEIQEGLKLGVLKLLGTC